MYIPKFKGDNYTHDHEVGIIATLIIDIIRYFSYLDALISCNFLCKNKKETTIQIFINLWFVAT